MKIGFDILHHFKCFCIENSKMKKPRQSRADKIDFWGCDFLENAKFISIFSKHLANVFLRNFFYHFFPGFFFLKIAWKYKRIKKFSILTKVDGHQLYRNIPYLIENLMAAFKGQNTHKKWKNQNKFVRTKMRPKEGTKIKLQREIFRFGQIC